MDNYQHLTNNKGSSSRVKIVERANTNSPSRIGMATKGVAMSFGFKRRPGTAPPPSVTDNGITSKNITRNEVIDTNGNGTTRTKTTPRQESTENKKTTRFTYRPPNINKHNVYEQKNINRPKMKSAPNQLRSPSTTATFDPNENKTNYYSSQLNRYTFQTAQLPKPQLPTKVHEIKDTKTMMNINRKISRKYHTNYENYNQKPDRPAYTELPNPNTFSPYAHRHSPRDEDVDIHSLNMFDLVDTDELVAPIPSLPSAFQNNASRGFGVNREPKPNLNTTRKSVAQVQKPPDLNLNKKTFLKANAKDESLEEYEWMQAGDAMADDISFSLTSSLQSRECKPVVKPLSKPVVKPETLMLSSLTLSKSSKSNSGDTPNKSVRKMFLNIEDPKFAAVAAASTAGTLLEDEPSPVDSITISYSENEDKRILYNNDLKKKSVANSSSDSKDINEKLTKSSSSPGTPTNASNSLSLSDGKDYFDDEIADQPALVFDEATSDPISAPQHNSENTPTIINTTPKLRRKPLNPLENSPLFVRKKNALGSSTTSMDTLSPCESIASDDLMFDFDNSHGDGIDDVGRTECVNNSLSATKIHDNTINDFLRECSNLFTSSTPTRGTPIRANHLLRSRASTPDSATSFNSRVSSLCNPLAPRSPRRLSRPTIHDSLVGYESDDPVSLDKSNHTALVQDVVQMKSMLVKLKKILNESESIIPIEQIRGTCSESDAPSLSRSSQLELAELKRQIVFLQDQLEDREQMVLHLQKKMEVNESTKIISSVVTPAEIPKSNAATQTERVRPLSSSASLIQMSPTDSSMGSLVSWSKIMENSYQKYTV